MAVNTYVLITYKDSGGSIAQQKLKLSPDVQTTISIKEIKEVRQNDDARCARSTSGRMET